MQRAAGKRLNLPAELVTYIGEAAQAGRPIGDGAIRTPEDAAIAELVSGAIEQEIAGGPSFDLRYPKVPGRDFEGIPNADQPVMRERLRQRLLRNPSGTEELPGFLVRGA